MINLSDNTNAWGMPPAARSALAGFEATSRYPSPYADDLKAAISAYAKVPADMVTTGCGSDDVLDSALRIFARNGRVAFPEPTFVMVPIFARLNGGVPVPVPMATETGVDVNGMIASDADVLYLCSPNNPTGNVLARAAIEELIRRATPTQVIIIDEAYADFAGADMLDLARSCDRVLVTRTFSKAFGLAGLRVGYGVGHPSLIAEIERSRGPYKVSAPAECAAVAALTDGLDWVREHAALAVGNRRRLEAALVERGLSPIPSSANFVFFPIERSAEIARAMRVRGVAVRDFSVPSGLRFTVGTWPELVEALAAFDEARAACA